MPETAITIKDFDRLTAAVLVVAQAVNRLAVERGIKDVPNVIDELETLMGDVTRFRIRPPQQ